MADGPKIVAKTIGTLNAETFEGPIDDTINILTKYKTDYPNATLYYIGDGEIDIMSEQIETEEEYQARLEYEKTIDEQIRNRELREYARLKAKYGDIQ